MHHPFWTRARAPSPSFAFRSSSGAAQPPTAAPLRSLPPAPPCPAPLPARAPRPSCLHGAAARGAAAAEARAHPALYHHFLCLRCPPHSTRFHTPPSSPPPSPAAAFAAAACVHTPAVVSCARKPSFLLCPPPPPFPSPMWCPLLSPVLYIAVAPFLLRTHSICLLCAELTRRRALLRDRENAREERQQGSPRRRAARRARRRPPPQHFARSPARPLWPPGLTTYCAALPLSLSPPYPFLCSPFLRPGPLSAVKRRGRRWPAGPAALGSPGPPSPLSLSHQSPPTFWGRPPVPPALPLVWFLIRRAPALHVRRTAQCVVVCVPPRDSENRAEQNTETTPPTHHHHTLIMIRRFALAPPPADLAVVVVLSLCAETVLLYLVCFAPPFFSPSWRFTVTIRASPSTLTAAGMLCGTTRRPAAPLRARRVAAPPRNRSRAPRATARTPLLPAGSSYSPLITARSAVACVCALPSTLISFHQNRC